MAEARIEVLMNLYDDTVRLRQKLLGYNFFHEVLSTVPICLRNQEVLEARVREKIAECDKLRKWLKISQDKVSVLYSQYDNLNDYYEVFIANNYAHEFLDFAIYLKNRCESHGKNNANVNSVTNHWFQSFENLLKNHFVKGLNNDNPKQKQELETLRTDNKQNCLQCDGLKLNLNEANRNICTLRSNLKTALASLNTEQIQCKRLQNERDNFDRLSAELCRLLFKYQQRFCPVDRTRKTKDPLSFNSEMDENSSIEIKPENTFEYEDEFPISLLPDFPDDGSSEEILNQSTFCSNRKNPTVSNNETSSKNSAVRRKLSSPEPSQSFYSPSEPSTSTFSLSMIASEWDFDSDSSDDSEIEIGRYHSFEETDVNNQTAEKPEITADLNTNTSVPVKSNEKPASSKTSNDAAQPHFSHHRTRKVKSAQLFRCVKCGKYFRANKCGRILVKCPVCNILGTMKKSERTIPGDEMSTSKKSKLNKAQCDICKKHYLHKQSLRRHIEVVHSEARPFKCDTCGKSFADKRNLKVHYYVHAKEKKFKCAICDKAFKDPTVRYNHETIIHGEPRFECAHCGKRFKAKQSLSNHIQTWHFARSRRQYKCDICNKRFASKNNLRNRRNLTSHMKNHHAM